MVSRTHVCNLALIEIGEEPITDINDITTNASRCRLILDDVVDEVSSSRYWSRIKKRVELAVLAQPPEYEFNFQFQLPSDNLQVISINNIDVGGVRYQIEGTKLLINDSSVFIKYISTQRNPDQWGQFLQRAIVLRLAAGLAYIITGSTQLQETKYLLYEKYSMRSTSTDSNQGSRRKVQANTITRVR